MVRALHIVRHGEPEQLVLATVQVPAPGPDEITIDVHAAGVNFPDLLVVRGTYQNLAPLPFSPGKEVAGIVSAVGESVGEFRVGDHVLAFVENGGYVERITVPAFLCHPMPEGLDAADAIGLGLTFQTAHFALFARGQMKPGETVLVTGATGGVGSATAQLAKACGATVIAGCTTASKADFARDHGADHVVMLDRPDLDRSLRAEIAALTGGRGVDVVVENLGGQVFDACLRTVAWCGRIVVVGFAAGAAATLRSNYLLIKNIAAVGLHWSDYRDRTPSLVSDAQKEIFDLWRQGRLVSPVTEALRLDDAVLALRRIADRKVRGKIVLLTERYAGRLVPSSDPVSN
ncbi:NADPH:quinone oxidoreductase family protein [Bradyrhizobium sp.]|uniref:NADPH:quinone oxidoreductase family protein n=1 Tax=Bradyrhizobium sp. TaxID=376 RepID=UPI002385B04D|nr:NADPH:quinone oxidoreductase family protein [Bradyrhizobium sp.]MDE2380200.1 NADPH:quinone oxidoreductase family protein [Bradyrhizobium sp.]